jgi:hypothetical protein
LSCAGADILHQQLPASWSLFFVGSGSFAELTLHICYLKNYPLWLGDAAMCDAACRTQ